jgi:DNA (cytosine-5)-methyltransferase 1
VRGASLFAGIGGFDLAFQGLGLRTSLAAEIDPAARRVLAERFPHTKLAGDATQVDLRGFDVVAAGFPCQGLSNAAATRKHSGLLNEESRSAVVWRVLERIEGVPFVCLENASSLTTARYAADLAALLTWFREHDYDARVYVLNAGLYGTPMRRERAFILARLKPMPWPDVARELRFRCAASVVGVSGQQGGAAWCVQPSPTLKSGTYTLAVTPDELRSVTPAGLEVLLGFPPGHTAPAGSSAQRYMRLGNAVAVHAAEVALRILLTGKAPPPRAPAAYPIDLTVRARGGTSGSMVRRIYRSITAGRGNHSKLELDFCLPVYIDEMRRKSSTVSHEMWRAVDALHELKVYPSPPPPWPSAVEVTLKQVGRLQ